MKPALLFALGLASATIVPAAHAQTYQWKDANGRTVISDTPPPTSARSARTLGGKQASMVIEAPDQAGEATKPGEAAKAEGTKTTAEKELEFRKRQLEAREKAEKEAKEQTAAREKKENCERAQRNLAALGSNTPLATVNDKGERQLMDNSERDQETERARRVMTESCK